MFFGIFIFALIIAFINPCPVPEHILPCTCTRPGSEEDYVTCSNLDNDHDLVKAASSLTRSSVYSFVIQDSIFMHIPSDAFKGLKFHELEIKDSTLMALTDTDVAFEGLEDHLAFFMMTSSTLMNGWDWRVFRNLKKLTRLDVTYANLESIEDLDHINASEIQNINFSHNIISFVDPFAFSSFVDLANLSLADNSIRTLYRTMLPNPARPLRYLDFSNNEIEQFPKDMFTEMPFLEKLSIERNKLLALDEETFLPVWQDLDQFKAMFNELRCDCRISWIIGKYYPKEVLATCAQPPELRGKPIEQLTSKELWCYV